MVTHGLCDLFVIIRLNSEAVGTRVVYKSCCRGELWDRIISSPFVKDGPVYPMLKEIIKEALSHLSYAFKLFEQL